MSITLKTNQVKLKIQNGNYQAPVVIADQTTSEHVAEVNTAITATGNQQVSAIQTKGDEVLDSIPEDYTDLVEDVGDLKSAFGDVTSIVPSINLFDTSFEVGSISGSTGMDDNSITSRLRSGYIPCNNGDTFTLSKKTSATTTVYVFYYDQNKNWVRKSSTSAAHGIPYGLFPLTFTVDVKTTPDSVAYMRFRLETIIDVEEFQVEKGAEAHSYVSPDPTLMLKAKKLDEPMLVLEHSKNIGCVWENGGINYSDGTLNTADHLRTKVIPVIPGETYAVNIKEKLHAHSVYVFFYDENGNYVTKVTAEYGYFPKVITIPETTPRIAFMRLNMQTAPDTVDTSNAQAEQAVMSTTYRPAENRQAKIQNLPNSVINYLGKKVVVFGDSITAIGDVASTASTGWTSWFQSSVKPSAFYNYAVGGSSWLDYSSGHSISEQIDNFISANISDVDCFIISSGTNDLNHTIPTDAEIESQFYDSNMDVIPLANVDKTTWAGAIRYAVEKLRTNSREAKIFICTPLLREYDANEPVRSLYGTIKDKCEIIKMMCYRLGVECIDTHECGVYANTTYLIDKLHPTITGARLISEYIISRFMQWFNIN